MRKHQVEILDAVFAEAGAHGVVHQNVEDYSLDGKTITVEGGS